MAYDPNVFYLGASGSEQPLSANDASLAHSVEDLRKDTRLAGGKLISYKILQVHQWQWRYTWLPAHRRDVFDGGMSRDDLYALYQADEVMSYLTPEPNAPHTTYSVRFAANSWRERIVRRAGDFWAFEVMFTLVQVQ